MKVPSRVLYRVRGCVLVASLGLLLPDPASAQGLATANCDANGDATRDLSDAVQIMSWLFLGGPEPVAFDCPEPPEVANGDCNGDGVRDLSDAVWLLTGLFLDNTVLPVEVECPGQGSLVYVGSLTRTRGRWTYLGQPGPSGAEALCEQEWPGSVVCTRALLEAAEAAGELVDAVDVQGNDVLSFWVTDPDAAPENQCWNKPGESIPWSYATGHLGVRGQFVVLNRTTGELGAVNLDNRCRDSHWVPCCNP